jgi:hypothetical protein
MIRGELAFDSIRVYFGDTLHIDIRRSAYRGLQAWKWQENFKIEFSIADTKPMLAEYTSEELWLAVLEELKKLPLSGD